MDTVFCDCNQAKSISLSSNVIYGKTISPKGFGTLNEISLKKQKTNFAFDEEHNSAWYKLIINESGDLVMDIIPTKADDDYDFMLFKADKNDFCDSLQKYKIAPVRACISRDKEELLGKTGLNTISNKEFVKHGIGPAYCKKMPVKKGEVYYLVLDNVYENGEGHTIKFEISQKVLIKGIITDENNNPIQAEVLLTNNVGDTVLLKKTGVNGEYNFYAPLVSKQVYNLNFYNEGSICLTQSFKVSDSLKLKSINTILPRLKKGNKYSIGAINFMGGSVKYLARSVPAMNNLYKLLKKNPKLKIKIIGHSNGRNGNESDESNVKFTLGRANTIKMFLIKQGIDSNRIEIDGKGDSEMLFDSFKGTPAEQEQNRRVEVMVLEF